MTEYPENWRKQELRIYLRDVFFFAIIAFISVSIAEGFFISGEATAVDRIFTYLLVFIPLGTLNLVAHYYYRNHRIRITGKLRTSLRYRLSLAFMLVSVIPSIPIFFISSNIVQQIAEGMFHLNVTSALDSARTTLDHYRAREVHFLVLEVRHTYPDLFRHSPPEDGLIANLYRQKILERSRDFAAFYKKDGVESSAPAFFRESEHISFKPSPSSPGVSVGDSIFQGMHYVVLRFPTAVPDEDLLLAYQQHPEIIHPHGRFNAIYSELASPAWRDTIPDTLRLGLGIIYVLMICAALVLSIFLGRQIATPIVSLAAATREVADGKLDTRIEMKSQGEIGILINSFNAMTGQLRTLRSRLLQSQRMAAWREVARRLAHEIMNPLTPIQLSAERMLRRFEQPERGDLKSVVQNGAATIIEQVQVLKQMVREFADFARLPSARPTPNALGTLVLEAGQSYQGIPGIDVLLEPGENLPDVLLDRSLVLGMINNLMKNAVEAIRSTGRTPEQSHGTIRVSAVAQTVDGRRYVILKIADDGPGMEANVQERIFEPYYTTRPDQGSGLGLALVEKTVLEHNARIIVRSTPGQGTEFSILFPVHDA